jgi:hypothetical protein
MTAPVDSHFNAGPRADFLSLGAVCLLYACAAVIIRGVFRWFDCDSVLRGSPRSVWVHGVLGIIVFAILAAFTACAQGPQRSAWEVLFIYCFCGHLAKDFLAPMDAVFVLHHAASFVGVAAVWTKPAIYSDFVAVITAFEIGSGAQGFWVLDEGSRCRQILFSLAMPLSNLTAIVLIVSACTRMEESWPVRAFFFSMIAAFAFLRQQSPLLAAARLGRISR